MTNHEKLCEAVGLKFVCSANNITGIVYRYPQFAAEKQLELIKLLGCSESFTADFTEISPRNDNEQWACICHFKTAYNSDFSEALAGLTLQLVEAGELDKEEVKRILK